MKHFIKKIIGTLLCVFIYGFGISGHVSAMKRKPLAKQHPKKQPKNPIKKICWHPQVALLAAIKDDESIVIISPVQKMEWHIKTRKEIEKNIIIGDMLTTLEVEKFEWDSELYHTTTNKFFYCCRIEYYNGIKEIYQFSDKSLTQEEVTQSKVFCKQPTVNQKAQNKTPRLLTRIEEKNILLTTITTIKRGNNTRYKYDKQLFQHGYKVTAHAGSGDNKYLAVGLENGSIVVWEIDSAS